MFKISNLKFKNILNIEDLTINKDNTTFIYGDSGCGKSTLLKLLLGIRNDYEGKILYKNDQIKKISELIIRDEIGYLSQSPIFFKQTIKEEFEYILDILGLKTQDYLSVLKLVELEYPLTTSISTLSGGEKQRLSLARLLITNKSVLLLDEPTSALNDELEHVVFNKLNNYAKKHNIKLIVVSHSTNLVNSFDGQKIKIKDGEVIKNEL